MIDAGHDIRRKILKKSECKIIATILQPQKMGTHCLSGFPQFIVYSNSVILLRFPHRIPLLLHALLLSYTTHVLQDALQPVPDHGYRWY